MNVREQKHVTESMSQLQQKSDNLTRASILEQRRVTDLDQALRSATAEVANFRARTKKGAVEVLNLHRTTANPIHARADGIDPTKQADRNQKRLVATLEARLNKLLVRHSEIVNGNANLKEAICHMRKQRMTTDDVHRQYETEILEVRRRIAASMEQAALLTEERERLTKERDDVLAADAEEAAVHNRRLNEIAAYVAQQNADLEASVADAARGANLTAKFEFVTQAGNLSVTDEEAVRQKLIDLAAAEAKEHEQGRAIEARSAWFAAASDELKRVSGIDDLDRLVRVFVVQEADNFALFNYLQAIGQEIDQGLEKADELARDIRVYEAEAGIEEQQRRAVIQSLEDKVAAQARARAEWDARVADAAAACDLVAKRVQSIFFKIQCDHYLQTVLKEASAGGKRPPPGLDSMAALLSGQGITESNVLAYMSLIEQRSVQIVTAYAKKLLGMGMPANFLSGPHRPPGWEVSARESLLTLINNCYSEYTCFQILVCYKQSPLTARSA
jgi:coiled-coil domain-containing protein 63/114